MVSFASCLTLQVATICSAHARFADAIAVVVVVDVDVDVVDDDEVVAGSELVVDVGVVVVTGVRGLGVSP
jgi:hypothetical protein